MPSVSGPAIVCAARPHGEHGAIARILTPDHGLLAGYVPGGQSRTSRPVLIPGNRVMAQMRARPVDQLPRMSVELDHSMAPLLSEPLAAAAIDWLCGLTAGTLPEGHGYPALYAALSGVLDAVEAAPAARGWAVGLVRYELLLLAQLGFGLQLDRCAVSGVAGPLGHVSPRTGGAVCAEVAAGYEGRLLRLPPFLARGGTADWPDLFDGLRLTGHFLDKWLLVDRRADLMAVRERLIDRLKRVVA